MNPFQPNYLFASTVGLLALISFESFTRRKYPDHWIRPSNSMNIVAEKSAKVWRVIGKQFARFTDIYGLLVEYFPYQDIIVLTKSTFALVSTPFYVFKGYHDYYTSTLTPIQYGFLSSVVVVSAVCGTLYCVGWNPTQIRGSIPYWN